MFAPIDTVEEFYAHALAIEREAAARYLEFADHFAGRGEAALEGLCRNLAAEELEHFDGLRKACAGLKLPAVPAGHYRWVEGDAPESPSRELLGGVAAPRNLLEIALAAEWRAHEFFVRIARTAPARAVRELAGVMAAEEAAHVKWVRDAIEYRALGETAPTGK